MPGADPAPKDALDFVKRCISKGNRYSPETLLSWVRVCSEMELVSSLEEAKV